MVSVAQYAVKIDWNNNESFADAGDDVTARVRGRKGVLIERGRDQLRALAPPMAGSAKFGLDNTSRDYSPENASSPLAGLLYPGHAAQVQAVSGGSTYALFSGRLDGLAQRPEAGQRAVEISCLSTLSRLVGQKISTPLYQNVTTDEALGYILDAIGVDSSPRVLDAGQTTMRWWWLDQEDAFTAAKTLLATEGPGAALYEDGQGRIHFESRHYRYLTTRSAVSQATFSDSGSEPLHSVPFKYDPGITSVVNVCRVDVKVRSAKTLAAIWSIDDAVSLAPAEVRQIAVKPTDDEPFTGAVTPSGAGGDYTVTAGSLASLSLDRTSGGSCAITLTAGSSGATITGLRLRAQPVTVDSVVPVANTIDTSTSRDRYGVRTYTLPTRAEISANDAQDFVNAVVARYQNPRPTVQITITNATAERLAQILGREVSDRITVVEAQTGLDGDCWIERITHEIDGGGQIHRVVLGCERATDDQVWILGDAELGVLGSTTALGY
jgi:hypothetical protein